MKISDKKIEQIRKEAKKRFKNLGPSHDWSHVKRVLQTAIYIAEKEGFDTDIVKTAVYLHDIGRESLKEKGYDHAVAGAKMAYLILRKHGFSEDKIREICHCIETHRFRNDKIPGTNEAKCLFDADKLDTLGALGIARSYIYLGEMGNCVLYAKPRKRRSPSREMTYSVQDEYEAKYKHLPKQMLTKTGKSLALKRLKRMRDFLGQLEKEALGES